MIDPSVITANVYTSIHIDTTGHVAYKYRNTPVSHILTHADTGAAGALMRVCARVCAHGAVLAIVM